MSELAANQRFHFVVKAMDGSSAGIAEDSYDIRQVDQGGNIILNLIMPSSALEAAVLERVDLFISLNPSGELSIVSESGATADLLTVTTNIEQLIKHSITPQMLEDENDIAKMLQTLKNRLTASLATVNEAISNLELKSKL